LAQSKEYTVYVWVHSISDPEKKFTDPADDASYFYVIQPGSTIATSLSTEEAEQKHIGLLWVEQIKTLLHWAFLLFQLSSCQTIQTHQN
jgi:hypothetical protein